MLPWLILGVGVLGALCVAYGVLVERRWYRLTRYRLDILPAAGPATIHVLHLSDLHVVRSDRRLAAFLAGLPRPDVVVVTGDFLAEPEAVETAVATVRPVRGRLASWFVLGSNDLFVPRPLNPLLYFVPPSSRRRRRARRGRVHDLVRQLTEDGWLDLDNTRCLTDLDGLAIEVTGLHDAHIDRADLRVLPRRDTGRLGIAVMHSPDSAPEAAACGYDLVVAGHTHGGQVRLPLVGALVTNSALPTRLASGLIRMAGSWLSLSPGLGTSKYAPFRFWCRPTAMWLELRRPS
ncbi:MAG TPA: metallophosphoesterase [Actinomycetota bacterium]|nr:metallophosphoesterase [Actinomycetota bacterium]